MAMRVSGMYSGMDTESIIADLVKVIGQIRFKR